MGTNKATPHAPASQPRITRHPRGKNDPARKDRIIAATLEIVALHGVHKTSHRGIAAKAGVPLGSLTYYFTGLDDILEQAFALLAERNITTLHDQLLRATSATQASEAIADYVLLTELSDPGSSVLITEMYSYANHNPQVRSTIQQWLSRVKESLALHFSPSASRAIDAFIEGLMIHRQMGVTERNTDRVFVMESVAALAERFPRAPSKHPIDPTPVTGPHE